MICGEQCTISRVMHWMMTYLIIRNYLKIINFSELVYVRMTILSRSSLREEFLQGKMIQIQLIENSIGLQAKL